MITQKQSYDLFKLERIRETLRYLPSARATLLDAASTKGMSVYEAHLMEQVVELLLPNGGA